MKKVTSKQINDFLAKVTINFPLLKVQFHAPAFDTSLA